jgi:hypothetical protein
MLAAFLKAVLDWLTGLVKSEIKQDVKATDADTPQEIVDDFRSSMRRKLRDDESSIHKGEQ